MSVNVTEECSAIQVFIFYFSAVMAYEKPLKEKLIGLFIGLSAIFAINIARIVLLFLVVVYAGGQFELFHVYIGQAVVIGVTYGVWSLWVENRLSSSCLFTEETMNIAGRVSLFFLILLSGLFFFDYVTHRNQPVPFGLSSLLVWQSTLLFKSCGLDISAIQSIKTGAEGAGKVFITTGCLSTPLIVLYYAFILSWPFRLKQKFFLCLAGIPLFYLIISTRVFTIFLLPYLEQEKLNFFYDNFYQIIFIFAFVFAFTGWIFQKNLTQAKRYLLYSALILIPVASIWHFTGESIQQLLVETPFAYLIGHTRSYDPHFILSRSTDFYALFILVLFPLLPGYSHRERLLYAIVFFFFLLIWVMGVSALLESLQLPLYPRVLRVIILLPLLAGWGYLLWRGVHTPLQRESENPAGNTS